MIVPMYCVCVCGGTQDKGRGEILVQAVIQKREKQHLKSRSVTSVMRKKYKPGSTPVFLGCVMWQESEKAGQGDGVSAKF